jgi:DNA helicase-2/ATP-dependent DNA helicase PcrA
MLNVFRREREVLEQYQQRFKYVMVDEYQDTNAVQYLWLRLIAQARKNICVVGDDDQSIYSWRGAEVANILRFEKDFPGAKVIRLEQNYRSTPHILGAASGLIAENSERLGKTLWTEQNGGDKVRVVGVWDGPEEARRVGDEIERLEREGCGSTRSPFWCARSSRRANSKTASSRSVSAIASSAASASTNAPKSAMRWPICA